MDDEKFILDDEFLITLQANLEEEPVYPSFIPDGMRNARRPEEFPLCRLIDNPNSYFKGTKQLSVSKAKKDYDFFVFDLPVAYLEQNMKITLKNQFLTSHFQMLLYDDEGNQIQRGQLDRNHMTDLSLVIPNLHSFNSPTGQYYLKVESEEDDVDYRLYVTTTGTDHLNFTKFLRTAAEIIGLEADPKHTKTKEQVINEIHEKQLKAFPEEERYAGDLTVGQLLYKISIGGILTPHEKRFVSIMANAFDFNEATKKAAFLTVSHKIRELFLSSGTHLTEGQTLTIHINANGTFAISGIVNEADRQRSERLLNENIKDELYHLYVNSASWLADASNETYQVALNIQFIERFLYQATKGIVRFEKLFLDKNNKIMGLPKKLNASINSLNYENIFYESLKDMILQAKRYEKKYGKENLPVFRCEFFYCDGEISIQNEV